MSIPAESYGHAVILAPKGEITEDTIDALKKAVEHHLESSEVIDLVFNFESVTFLDGCALEYMLDVQDMLSDRLGQVKFAKCDANIRKILDITRLDSTFEVCDDLNAAVQAGI